MINIRLYENNDLNGVNELLKESFNTTKSNFKHYDNISEIVATVNNQVVGYLILTKVINPLNNSFYFLIDYVCVLKGYRGQGISDKLMEFAENIAREQKATYIQLTCSRFRTSAQKLYERCGYFKRNSDIYRKNIN